MFKDIYAIMLLVGLERISGVQNTEQDKRDRLIILIKAKPKRNVTCSSDGHSFIL